MSDNNEDNEHEENEDEEDEDSNIKRAKYIFQTGDKEGHLEAPIDLNISTMTSIELNPLMWYNHDIVPKKLKLTNTGSTVILSAKWQRERPYLIDGPFLGKYVFSQLHFHWGENEMIGSEHYLDGCCMPMELHAVHFKADYLSQDEALRHTDGLAILAYLFRLQPSPNPALDQVLNGLSQVREPGDSVRLEPRRPLVDLLRPFSDDYFLYWGALVAGDSGLRHRVLWLVSRVPIPVAQEQIAQFRLVRDGHYEPLRHNCQALRERAGRSVFHANPSGRGVASLLPITREPAPLTANQMAEIVEQYQPSGP